MSTPTTFTPVVGTASTRNSRSRAPRVPPFQDLAERWKPEIAALAEAMSTPWCHKGDLEQAGLIALWRASKHFRASLGTFEHYARRAIRRWMLRERSQTAPLSERRPDIVSLDADDAPEVGRDYDPLNNEHAVADWVGELPGKLCRVFDLLYRQGYTQKEAAAMMGLSQGRIAQLHARLLAQGGRDLTELAA